MMHFVYPKVYEVSIAVKPSMSLGRSGALVSLY
jgi:hypothetical protein